MINKNKLVIGLIVIVLIFSAIVYVVSNNNEESYEGIYLNSQELEEVANVEEIEKIKIHIIGEINNPGIYELDIGSRIQDAIISAGGTNINADLDKVNLAYELEDGQKIKIPSIFDEQTAYIYNDSGENVLVQDENSSQISKKVNINKATETELQEINGVGPSLAQKIITYRNENGKFKSIEDLKNVSGIGEKKYEIIKEYVSIK